MPVFVRLWVASVSRSRLIACTTAGEAVGADVAAAAVAVAASSVEPGSEAALVVDLQRSPRPLRGTLLASAAARQLESVARDAMGFRAAARGKICIASPEDGGREVAAVIEGLSAPGAGSRDPAGGFQATMPAPLVVCVCEPTDFRDVLAAAPEGERAALVRALPGADRSLLALLVGELRSGRIPIKAWTAPIGTIPGRRALAGLEPGGATGRRAARFAASLGPARGRSERRPLGRLLGAEGGQALPAVLGIAVLIVSLALILVALGGAATAKGRLQRSADLAALSAARSMRDDYSRLFVPVRLRRWPAQPRASRARRVQGASGDGGS